jgi:hypothetical protein
VSDGVQGTGPGGNGGEGPDSKDAAWGKDDGARTEQDSGEGSEGLDSRDPGGSERDEKLTADFGGGQGGAHGAYAVETPEQVLGEVKSVRRRTRSARHAYWFPLMLFGLLTLASIPFYIEQIPKKSGAYFTLGPDRPAFLRLRYLDGTGIFHGRFSPYYWLAAILVGLAATALWYRWRGDRVGLRTPARGYLLTGLVLLLLALGIPALATSTSSGLGVLEPGDLVFGGTFPQVIIGVGLCYLAWAERSIALTLIAAGYLALSVVASLYDIENVFYRLGWNLSPEVSRLPNVVLPALVLLLAGAGAWVVQRRYRPLAPEPAAEQTA